MHNSVLIKFIRSGLAETEHYANIYHLGTDKVICDKYSSNCDKFFLRSCMKPLQASILVDFDLINYFDFSLEEIAVCTASHVGERHHIKLVQSILKKIGLSDANLLCPAEPPLSKTALQKLIKENTSPSKLHSNCSGKHAMMLAACIKNGWNIKDYNDFEHPLQKYISKKISEFAKINENNLPKSLDGCGLPVYALSLEELAKSFINLFSNSKYEMLKNAFITYPYTIGGQYRTDSEIIQASQGKLIAKVGAGGLICIFNTTNQEAVAIKVKDANMRAREIVTIEYLKKIDWLEIGNIPDFLGDKSIKTTAGKPLGSVECIF